MTPSLLSKTCRICLVDKPLEDYKLRTDTGKYRSQCIACTQEAGRTPEAKLRTKAKNARRKDYSRQYYLDNQEKISEYDRKRYEANRVEVLARNAAYYLANKEYIRMRQQAYEARTKEAIAERIRLYRQAHREEINARNLPYNHRRRALLQASPVHFTIEEWIDLCEFYEYRCLACNRDDRKMTVDHVIPLSRGGHNGIANLQPLCGPCNSSKYTKTTDYRAI